MSHLGRGHNIKIEGRVGLTPSRARKVRMSLFGKKVTMDEFVESLRVFLMDNRDEETREDLIPHTARTIAEGLRFAEAGGYAVWLFNTIEKGDADECETVIKVKLNPVRHTCEIGTPPHLFESLYALLRNIRALGKPSDTSDEPNAIVWEF